MSPESSSRLRAPRLRKQYLKKVALAFETARWAFGESSETKPAPKLQSRLFSRETTGQVGFVGSTFSFWCCLSARLRKASKAVKGKDEKGAMHRLLSHKSIMMSAPAWLSEEPQASQRSRSVSTSRCWVYRVDGISRQDAAMDFGPTTLLTQNWQRTAIGQWIP